MPLNHVYSLFLPGIIPKREWLNQIFRHSLALRHKMTADEEPVAARCRVRMRVVVVCVCMSGRGECRCGGAPPATARPSGVRRGIPSPDTARSAWGWIQPSCASQPSRRRLPRPAVRAYSASCRLLRVPHSAPSKRKKFCGRREGNPFKERPRIPSSHRIYPSSKGVIASAINQIEPLNTRNYTESLISVCFRAFRG